MQKQTPTTAKLAAMVAFTLSCFGLLLFLWVSFGGPSPLRPEGYRFNVRFDEATLLVQEADVRMAGLNVGKVKKTSLAEGGGTIAEIELDEAYAPIGSEARAILRPKSLLGQTYVELSAGPRDAEPLHDGHTLEDARVEESVEIDEVISAFDEDTRSNLQGWVRELATAIDKGRGEDLSDAFGNLPRFVATGADVLEVLDEEEPALRRLVKNTGIALGAINERRGQFQELIVNADNTFGALASRNEALAQTIDILPTFLDETRITVARLERFSVDTQPLVEDLQPVATDLAPTLRDVGRLAPDLEGLFRNLDPVIDEAPGTLPRAADFLRGASPVLGSLHPYLQQLNPIIALLNFQQEQVSDFISRGGNTLNATLPTPEGEGPRHYLRQIGILNSSGLALQRTRQPIERGNAYPSPNYVKRARALGMYEAFDCKPAGGEQPAPRPGLPPCFVQPPSLYDGTRFPVPGAGEDDLVAKPDGDAGREPATP
ncbi:MAG: MlaD family protein [Thermoleophilaceae bacterium]